MPDTLTCHPFTVTARGATTTFAYRPELDGLRGIAVLLVIQSHAGVGYNGGGTFGVTLFFVLSGYLITSILAREVAARGRVSLRGFYARRLRRLGPALVVLLVAVTVISVTTGRTLGPVIASALYVGNLTLASGFDMGLLKHAWSLGLEEQFYLLWPLALPALLRVRRPAVVLLCVAAASGGWRLWLWATGASLDRVAFGPDTRVDAILIGCAIALVGARVVPSWCVSAAVLVMVVTVGADWLGVPMIGPAALASAVFVAASARPGWLNTALTWRPVVWVGRISYGLYLWHFPIAGLTHAPNPVAQLVIVFAGSFVMAWLSWVLVERRFLPRRSPVAALPHRVLHGTGAPGANHSAA